MATTVAQYTPESEQDRVLQEAREAFLAGLGICPPSEDGEKSPEPRLAGLPARTWEPLKTRRATAEELRSWYPGRRGLGVIGGDVSGRVEPWDFDDPDTFDAFVVTAKAFGLGDVVDRIDSGYADDTPGGGTRWLVHYSEDVEHVSGSRLVLARRSKRPEEMRHPKDKIKVLIEIPAFVILAPSSDGVHPTGKPYVRRNGGFGSIASYTAEEREALLALARTFDEMPTPEPVRRRESKQTAGDGTRPGDRFNEEASWSDVLEPDGWEAVFTRGDTTYWRRPGKDRGYSATTNHAGLDRLIVFTSSTEFEATMQEAPVSYGKFGAYALLRHGGDFTAAAKALAAEGYGGKDQQDNPETDLAQEQRIKTAAGGLFDAGAGLREVLAAMEGEFSGSSTEVIEDYVLAVRPTNVDVRDAWPENPDLPGPPPPAPLPLDLPPVAADMAVTLHEHSQAPLDSAIVAVIGGGSAAIAGAVYAEICSRRKWVKPAHEYVGIEQTSGSGKDPVILKIREPFDDWQMERAEELSLRRANAAEQFEVEKLRVLDARKALAKAGGSEIDIAEGELRTAVKALQEAEKKPRSPFQYLIEDATEEEVVRLLADNDGRLASIDTEATLLEVAAGRYGGNDPRLTALIKGWDGGSMTVNRKTGDRRHLDVPAAHLALLLGTQPGVIGGMMNAETMRQRGVLWRFLWTAAEIAWDTMLTGADVPALNTAAVAAYHHAIQVLLSAFQTVRGSSDLSDFLTDELIYRKNRRDRYCLFRMSPEAQEVVYRIERMKVTGMSPGGALEPIESWAGKLPDHGARIGAILTLLDRASAWPGKIVRESSDKSEKRRLLEHLLAEPIPERWVRSAENLLPAIATHVVKTSRGGQLADDIVDARYLLRLARHMPGATQSQIRERARGRDVFRDAAYFKRILKDLTLRGCVRCIERARAPGPGRAPSPLIEVHPSLRIPGLEA